MLSAHVNEAAMKKALLVAVLLAYALTTPGYVPVAVSQPQGDVWQVYHDYNNLTQVLLSLNETYPDLIQVYSIGVSVEGRSIWVCEIWNRSLPVRPSFAVLVDAGIHGTDVIACESALTLINTLLNKSAEDPLVQKILNAYVLYVIPMLNPDGVEHAKNATAVEEAWRNARGVDLDRNFPWHWSEGDSDPTSMYYRGPSPLSEPETMALSTFVFGKPILLYISLRSGGKRIYYPWLHNLTETETVEEPVYAAICNDLTTAFPEFTWGKPLQAMPGSSIDWMYGNSTTSIPPLSLGVEVYEGSDCPSWWDVYNPSVNIVANYTEKVSNFLLYAIGNLVQWGDFGFGVTEYSPTMGLNWTKTFVVELRVLGLRNMSNVVAGFEGTYLDVVEVDGPQLVNLSAAEMPKAVWYVDVRSSTTPGDASFTTVIGGMIGNRPFIVQQTVTITLFDDKSPSVTILEPEYGAYVEGPTIVIRWEGSDVGAGIDHYEVRINDQTTVDVGTNTEYSLTVESSGSYRIEVIAYDAAGNVGADVVEFYIHVPHPTPGLPAWLPYAGMAIFLAVFAVLLIVLKRRS